MCLKKDWNYEHISIKACGNRSDSKSIYAALGSSIQFLTG
jgi:hypothetical protein